MELHKITILKFSSDKWVDSDWSYDDEGKFYYKGTETKIKQYCRYCSQLCYGDVAYCDVNGVKSTESCKTPNNCKHFEFNPIDAFWENENGYQPRKEKKYINQSKLEI